MKITDKVDKIDGVYFSVWNGRTNNLTIYYYAFVPLQTMKLRVTDALRDNFLDDTFNKVSLISVFD